MTTSSHHHAAHHTHQGPNVSRRASLAATSPYTIPHKQQHNPTSSTANSYSSSLNGSLMSPPPTTQTPQKRDPPMSSSVPVLSREFVVRRISEGESGRLKEELKCEVCGKGYKHVSSLAKHLWEHTPEWNVTKKLLISKHQQVQLLEAASILVSMNDLPKSVDVPPTIDEDVRFNEKYLDKSSSSTPPPHAAQSLKMRMNSISQHPPSSFNATFSPAKASGTNGGFLDVPKSHMQDVEPSSDKSSPSPPDEAEQSKNDVFEDDDGVFGEMD